MGSLLPLCLEGMFLNKCQLILMRATSSLLCNESSQNYKNENLNFTGIIIEATSKVVLDMQPGSMLYKLFLQLFSNASIKLAGFIIA